MTMLLPLSSKVLGASKGGSSGFLASCHRRQDNSCGTAPDLHRSSPVVSLASGPWGYPCCRYSIVGQIIPLLPRYRNHADRRFAAPVARLPQGRFAAGTPFVKTWPIRSSGTSGSTAGFRPAFVGGDRTISARIPAGCFPSRRHEEHGGKVNLRVFSVPSVARCGNHRQSNPTLALRRGLAVSCASRLSRAINGCIIAPRIAHHPRSRYSDGPDSR